MSSEQFEHIQRIRNEWYHVSESERGKDSINNAVQSLAEDLYKEHIHFIFELIQNAEDNTYDDPLLYPPSLSFRLTKTDPTDSEGSNGALIIQNNETGFNRADVDAICALGRTTKKKEQGYIGEKGIGFKSVFRVTKNPHIFSKGYRFCLPERDEQTGLGYIVPQWVDAPPEGFDLSKTYIILPLNKLEFCYEKIEKMLRDIEPETILFLLKLQEIRIETDTGTDLTIFKDNAAKPKVKILIKGKKQARSFSTVDDFFICTKCFDKPLAVSHKKREDIKDRKVSIAFPLDENSTKIGKIFAYLPIRSDTGFPFLINADFILSSSREDIHDVPWNHWLMECIANLVACELLPLLKERKHLTVPFLEALANKLNNLAEDKGNLFYPIFTRVSEVFMKEELLPANDDTFTSGQKAKLVDSEGLIDLLKPDQLSLLFEETVVIKWLVSDITARRTPDLWKYLSGELEIDVVDPDMFARKIDERFLKNQSDDWFLDFYKFLFIGPRPPKSLWNSSWSVLRRKPILRLQNGSLVNPNEQDVYLSKKGDSDTTARFVKVKIARNEDAHKFLKELGIPEWNIVAEVIRHILPKYRDNTSTIPIVECNRDYPKIVTAYKTDSKAKKNRLQEALQKTPFILTESTHELNPCYGKPNELYFGNDELRLYFQGNNSYEFVSSIYPDKHIGMFKQLGVSGRIRITCESKPGAVDDVRLSNEDGCYRRGLKGFDPNIQVAGLEHALMNPSVAKSKIIWEHIARPYSHCIKGKILKSSRQDFSVYAAINEKNEGTSDFGRLLMKNAWLPDSAGNMHKPSELSLKELPEDFVRDDQLADRLGMKKNAVAELAEETGIPIEIIEEFRRNPERYTEFKAWMAEKEVPEERKDEENSDSTTKDRAIPEMGSENTNSVDNESASHTPPRSSVSGPNSQGSSQRGTSRGGSGGGGGPSEKHENLKNDLAHNPSQLGDGLRLVKKEHRFNSGDKVDILLIDSSGKPVTVEVKPYYIPSGNHSEILQALKYKHLAADDYDIPCKQVRCILAAPGIHDDVKKKCSQLGIEPFIPT